MSTQASPVALFQLIYIYFGFYSFDAILMTVKPVGSEFWDLTFFHKFFLIFCRFTDANLGCNVQDFLIFFCFQVLKPSVQSSAFFVDLFSKIARAKALAQFLTY
jgi:hypothetical protein